MLASIWITLALSISQAASLTPRCLKPALRKEWREHSLGEKKAFLDAVKCLATKPHNAAVAPDGSEPDVPPLNVTSNRYDDFVFAHADGVIRNHFTGVFLSWHRFFLHTMESELQSRCGFTGTLPYWDWSRDIANITAAPPFTSDPETGFGTFNPDESEGFAVTDGAFGTTFRAYPTPHLVGRHFRPQPFEEQIFPFTFPDPDKLAVSALTPQVVEQLIAGFVGDYAGFQAAMDGVRAQGMHNAAHLMLEGDMSNISHSPNDPIFFLHHANLDRIWADWQKRHIQNARAIGGGRVQNLTFFDEWPAGSPPFIHVNEPLRYSGLVAHEPIIADVLDTKGGTLCYVYSS